MDNVQDTVQTAPTQETPVQGQVEPTAEQTPSVPEGEPSTPEATPAPEKTRMDELMAKKNFKSPDDLAKAYEELESHKTKVEQDNSELQKLFFEEPKSPSQEAQPTLNADQQALQELDKFVSDKVDTAVSQERARTTRESDKRDLTVIMQDNPDFGTYAKDVKELKGKYPGESFQDLYDYARSRSGAVAEQARAEGMKSANEALISQSQAQTVPAQAVGEKEVPAEDLLKGAGKRWKASAWEQTSLGPLPGRVNPNIVKDIEETEKSLFGRVLEKTQAGL